MPAAISCTSGPKRTASKSAETAAAIAADEAQTNHSTTARLKPDCRGAHAAHDIGEVGVHRHQNGEDSLPEVAIAEQREDCSEDGRPHREIGQPRTTQPH
jgi:hypothetical protein